MVKWLWPNMSNYGLNNEIASLIPWKHTAKSALHLVNLRVGQMIVYMVYQPI
jgi:hypothetical protein